MNLSFCDLCNESIPQADLDLGRAVRRNERLICAACERAMSAGVAQAAPASGPLMPPAAPRASAPSGSAVPAVALALAAVALVAGAGGVAYLYWRFEARSAFLEERLGDVARVAPEHARTVSAALVEETGARESELAAARAELVALATRLAELEEEAEGRAALERRIEGVAARLSGLEDLGSRVDHQSGALQQLASTVGELTATLARAPAAAPVRTPEGERAQREAAAPTPSAPPSGEAVWGRWVTELTSPDSGTRWQAVQALGDSDDPAVVPHLLPMLDDADIFVRMAACRHLGDLGSLAAIPALIETLEDEEASVREAALVSLRALSGQSIPFDPLARDGDRSKRVKAWREWWEQAAKELGGKGKTKG
jgi:Skp family chaperone for outer membrane proteins